MIVILVPDPLRLQDRELALKCRDPGIEGRAGADFHIRQDIVLIFRIRQDLHRHVEVVVERRQQGLLKPQEYMFRLVVEKKYVPTDILKLLDKKPEKLPAWDPMFLPEE